MTTGGEEDRADGFFARSSSRVRRLGTGAVEWLTERRAVNTPVDVAALIYERDRSQFGSVFGSAVAFRLFLFMLSLSIVTVGAGTLLVNVGVLEDQLADNVGITGALAVEIDEAFQGSQTTAWVLLISGLAGTLWSGKNLAATLVAVSSASWNLSHQVGDTTVRVVGTIVGLFALLALSTAALAAVRRAAGMAVATTSLLALLVVYAASWFVITLPLPRRTPDPGALLPGSALVAMTMTLMQGTTQLYLVPRLDSKSEILGGLGIAAVTMGWMFFASRAMVASLSVNAVVFEQFGSVSGPVFHLPGLRRIPRRFPSVARYFDLDGY